MIDEQDISRQVSALEQHLQDKLGLRRGSLARRLSKAGRRLPRRIHTAGKTITDAQLLLGHPKLARQIDAERLSTAFTTLNSHLETINPADRRKGLLLDFLGAIVLNLMVLSALIVGFLLWRGVI